MDREIGDPKHKPNPCLGPVEKAPFYAIKIYPGDGSTTVGLKIDEHFRVLDAQGDPLPGLSAAGLDANSIWRGKSPGPQSDARRGGKGCVRTCRSVWCRDHKKKKRS